MYDFFPRIQGIKASSKKAQHCLQYAQQNKKNQTIMKLIIPIKSRRMKLLFCPG